MKTKNRSVFARTNHAGHTGRIFHIALGALVAGGALASAGSALAAGPYSPYSPYHSQPYPAYQAYQAPVVVYGQPRPVPVDIQLVIGWQNDGRYWDGRRYWMHDEWMRHHPRDPGPPRYHHDDRRPHY